MTLESVQRVANLVTKVAAVGPVCGKVATLQMLFAIVPAPRHFGAERADDITAGVAHQIPVSQLIQARIQTCHTYQQQESKN
jgi:hypothetical protein